MGASGCIWEMSDDGTKELYDHNSDPNEWANLVTMPEYNSVIQAFCEALPKVNRRHH